MTHKDPEQRRIYARNLARKRRARGREERWAQRRARIEGRTQHAPADLAWAAGLFEGEGTVAMARSSGKHRSVRVTVTLTSTDAEVIGLFHTWWPGQVRSFQPRGNARRATVWTLGGSEAVEAFLRDVGPYLRTDRVRSKFTLALTDISDRLPYAWDREAHARSAHRMAEMTRLNRRGGAPQIAEAYRIGVMPSQLQLTGPSK